MSFKNLVRRQEEMNRKLNIRSDPILEFRNHTPTTRFSRVSEKPYVFVILDKTEKVLYVGRAISTLSGAFSKMTTIHESATLELFPFTHTSVAEAFQKRLIYHFKPKYNQITESSEE